MGKKSQSALPIKMWVLAVLLAFAACCYQSLRGKAHKWNSYRSSVDVKVKNKKNTTASIRILAIGSSMVSAAFEEDKTVSDLLSDRLGEKVDFLHVGLPLASAEDMFGDEALVNSLVDFDADYILIERGALLINDYYSPDGYHNGEIGSLEEYKAQATSFHPVVSNYSVKNWLERAFDSNEEQAVESWEGVKVDSLKDKSLNIRRSIASLPFSRHVERGLQKLANNGAKLIGFHVPYSIKTEERLASEPFKSTERGAWEFIAENYQIAHWDFSVRFPYLYFVDHTHLNEVGREKYTALFVGKLTENLHKWKLKQH